MNLICRAMMPFFLCVCVASFGCTKPDSAGPATTTAIEPLKSLTTSQQNQKQLAIDAKDKLFDSLLGELMKSMGEKGPAKSISVCKIRAPEIATQVSKDTGIRIGRTSFKLAERIEYRA